MEKLEFKSDKETYVFDAILQKKSSISFSLLKTTLRKKDIKINGKRISTNCKVYPLDTITIFLPDKPKKQVPVIYEDENIIIANKPQGMEVTKKDKGYAESDCLEDVFDAVACHRLDKNTEGLVVMAKNPNTENALHFAFKEHYIQKRYYAIVNGKVEKSANFEDYIKKQTDYVTVSANEVPDSKIAKTDYVLKDSKGELHLLDIQLLTGRTHQIRAQLAFHGIYVLGDEKYGQKSTNKKYHTKRQLLCAYLICFNNIPKYLDYLNGKTFEIKPTFENFLYDNLTNKKCDK